MGHAARRRVNYRPRTSGPAAKRGGLLPGEPIYVLRFASSLQPRAASVSFARRVMWSRSLIFTALGVYLVVVGCAVWPPESTRAGSASSGASGTGDDGGSDAVPPAYR